MFQNRFRLLSTGKYLFVFSSRRRHTRWNCDWSSDVCSSDLDAARALEEMLERWDKLEVRVREIKDLEHECDAITHRTFDKLNLTFITPLEREDIPELTSRLDDIVDHIDSTASRLF